MAESTDIRLRNLVIYSVYVRNHTPEGTFRAVIPDLDRIRALGADVVWLMPIHPIGRVKRKGTLGSPYAIRDYRQVNPEYGTMADFVALAEEIRARGMKCIIDVVFNHTSPDSVLWREHPDFFYKKPNGEPGNHVGEWSDVVDLDYSAPGLWEEQIETLRFWARYVDGFRCDVASFVPVEFWRKAREAVAEDKPDFLWLAESVHGTFGAVCRSRGMYSATDAELFSAFDIEYEYDIREAFDKYLRGETVLSHWMDLLNFQEAAYPGNYNKLRFLENHDMPRIASLVPDDGKRANYTALLFFLKGATLLYAGQEAGCSHLPSLFERDPVDWRSGRDISAELRALAETKKKALAADDAFFAAADDENHIAVMLRYDRVGRKLGVFSLRSKTGAVNVDFPDGTYTNLIDGERIEIRAGRLWCAGRPIILSTEARNT